MALNVETKDRKLGVVTDHNVQYHMGLACMVIGIGCVTAKNLKEAQARIDFINVIDKFKWGKPSINFTAKDLEGVWTNVTTETKKKWSTRIADGFLRDREQAYT